MHKYKIAVNAETRKAVREISVIFHDEFFRLKRKKESVAGIVAVESLIIPFVPGAPDLEKINVSHEFEFLENTEMATGVLTIVNTIKKLNIPHVTVTHCETSAKI